MSEKQFDIAGGPPLFDIMVALFVGHVLGALSFGVRVGKEVRTVNVHIHSVARGDEQGEAWTIEGTVDDFIGCGRVKVCLSYFPKSCTGFIARK